MARAPKRFNVIPGSELARLVEEAGEEPILLESNGALYRLDRLDHEPEDIFASYDPEKVREAVRRTAGSWADLDTDKLISDIRRWRQEGSRSADRRS